MTSPLSTAWAKWDRGKQHVHTVKRHFKRLIGPSEKYSIPTEIHVQADDGLSRTVVYSVSTLPDIEQAKFGLVIGDAINNFRSALDHATWIIVKRHGASLKSLKPGQRTAIQYPLARNRGSFASEFKKRLPGVPFVSKVCDVIETYQPYQRGNEARALRALNRLSNRDKHRLLIPTFWYPENVEMKLSTQGVSIVDHEILVDTSRRGRIKSGIPVLRVKYVVLTTLLQAQVILKGNFSVSPALGGGYWAMALLEGMRDTVKTILSEMETLL